jgi:hypothetical protein
MVSFCPDNDLSKIRPKTAFTASVRSIISLYVTQYINRLQTNAYYGVSKLCKAIKGKFRVGLLQSG